MEHDSPGRTRRAAAAADSTGAPPRVPAGGRGRRIPLWLRLASLGAVALLAVWAGQAGYRWLDRPRHHDRVGPGEIGRCYATPQQRIPSPAEFGPAADLQLRQDPTRAVMTGDPVDASERTRPILHGALVHVDFTVSGGPWSASGWLTRDRAGRMIVITSAAAVLDLKRQVAAVRLADVTATDADGRTAAVVDGCVIYESPAGLQSPGTPPPNPIDYQVAVFVLDHEIGTGTLRLSDQPATRGTWYTTSNLGGASTIGKPRHYDVLGVGPNREPYNGWYVLSGLEPYLRATGAADWTDHGASGSAVTTIPTDGNPPQVVGIIIGGFAGRPAPPDWLHDMFGVQITAPTMATPKIDYITPAAVIAAAIAALPPPNHPNPRQPTEHRSQARQPRTGTTR
jgi:hypothetical protein